MKFLENPWIASALGGLGGYGLVQDSDESFSPYIEPNNNGLTNLLAIGSGALLGYGLSKHIDFSNQQTVKVANDIVDEAIINQALLQQSKAQEKISPQVKPQQTISPQVKPMKIINGNILDVQDGIIGHVVNTQGVITAGLAQQIRNKYPNVYSEYQANTPSLGHTQFVPVSDKLVVANLAGQERYGREKRFTNYNALRSSFKELRNKGEETGLPIYLPTGIGAGRGGGDWNRIYQIIEEEIPEATLVNYDTKAKLDDPRIIRGTPIPMNYNLEGFTSDNPNPLPVNSTFDAMRGHGRIHTTRRYSPYKKHGIKKRDYAVVRSSNGRELTVMVGDEYPITPEMVADPEYQKKWGEIEKHHPSFLQTLGNNLYGMYLYPIGDRIDKKTIPFTDSIPSIKGTNIWSGSDDPLSAALTNPTVVSKVRGKIKNDYPVNYRGVIYPDAEAAYKQFKTGAIDQDIQVMSDIILAKLQQYPKLKKAIDERGGQQWIEKSNHHISPTYDARSRWTGDGLNSNFIMALNNAYKIASNSNV